MLAMGVAGLALCCVLPSLLAGGVLAAAAGWGVGVWAAIGIVAVALGALWLRGRRQRAASRSIDPSMEPLLDSGAPESIRVKVAK